MGKLSAPREMAPRDREIERTARSSRSEHGRAGVVWALLGQPEVDQTADGEAPSVPMLFLHYVELLEWTGRAVRDEAARQALQGSPPALITRLGLEPEVWLRTMSSHGLRSLGVLGRAEELDALAARQGKRWIKGKGWARKIFASAA